MKLSMLFVELGCFRLFVFRFCAAHASIWVWQLAFYKDGVKGKTGTGQASEGSNEWIR